MKKILLGTTAVIALGTMTTETLAADKIDLKLGGFHRQYVGLTDNDDEVAATNNAARDKSISQFANTEIYFTGSTTLDNGLTVAVRTELEVDSASTDNTDRNYLTVSSDAMGTLTLGSAPHFYDDNFVRAPMAGNFDWGDLTPWIGNATVAANASSEFTWSAGEIDNVGDDSIKVKYVSPEFSGFTIGGSYGWGEGATNEAHNARRVTGANDEGYSFGIAYSGAFSGADISADVSRLGLQDGNLDATHVGLNVGMSGFTVGGGYTDFSDNTSASNNDGEAWELGVGYETGPYSLSAAYMTSSNKGTAATAGDNEDEAWQIVATYDLGAGVALTATYFDIEADAEGAATTTKRGGNGLIAGIEVGF